MARHAVLDEIIIEKKQLRTEAILTIIAGAGLVIGVLLQVFDTGLFLMYAAFMATYVAGGWPAAKEAWADLRQRKLSIDLLMVLAALAAAGVGEVRDGAILLFLFSLASPLEGYAMGSTKRAVASLMSLHPDTAWKKDGKGNVLSVAVEELNVGDMVVVRPGERIPVDGIIVSGTGAVDQSPITGESIPVDKGAGDSVYAGTVNLHAVLDLQVSKLASHSTLARMIILVTEAHAKRAPSERFSDWFGERYTIVVLVGSGIGLLGFLVAGFEWSDALYRAATLLVVASPCAIVISVPAAVLSALTAAARRGALFKGGAVLETMAGVDIVAFDKTGTLTEGRLSVVEVVPVVSETDLLRVAAALEEYSEHPIARSICAYTKQAGIQFATVTEVEAIIGKGIVGALEDGDGSRAVWAGNKKMVSDNVPHDLKEAVLTRLEEFEKEGKTTVVVGVDDQVYGYIALADTPRQSAKTTIECLRRAGVKRIVMLSGDAESVTCAVGKELGLSESDIFGGLLPEEKVEMIAELRQSGVVAFVGDGVNDAAALATADVGIAMGAAGTDVAIEAADVALMSNDLRQLVTAQTIARQASVIIKQNLAFAVGIMLLMVAITVFWYLPLPLGVIGHEGGTLLVVLNGLRLLWQYR